MPTVPSPQTVLDRVRRDVERNALRARNGIKLVAGVDRPGVGQTPKDVVWQRGRTQLWHYRNENVRYGPPLLIVFSLISRSYILDLTPGNSFVEQLLEAGFDVYLLDWGEPDERDAANGLEDYVDDYIPAGIDRVLELSGAEEVNLFGYCFGGDLALLYAAHHPDAPLRSLTVLATPVDFRHMGPLADVFSVGRHGRRLVLGDDGNVPPSVVVQGFRTLKPTAEVSRYVTLWEKLWNDEYVASYQAMTGWSDDHVPFPGAAARQTVADARARERDGERPAGRRRGPGAPRRHPGAVPDRARQPRPHRPDGRDGAPDRPRRLAGQARARAWTPGTWGWSSGGRRRRRRCRRSSTSSAAAATRSTPAARRRPDMAVVPLGPERCDALLTFFAALPEGDLTFIREDVTDPETVRSWAAAPGAGAGPLGGGVEGGEATR